MKHQLLDGLVPAPIKSQSNADATEHGSRLLAVLLLALIVLLAVFSSAFRFGRPCARTLGLARPMGAARAPMMDLCHLGSSLTMASGPDREQAT